MTPKEKANKLFSYHSVDGIKIAHIKLICLEIIDEICEELDHINEFVEWDDDEFKEARYDYWGLVKREILNQ